MVNKLTSCGWYNICMYKLKDVSEEQESVDKHPEVMNLLNNMSVTFVSATIMIGRRAMDGSTDKTIKGGRRREVTEPNRPIYYDNLIVTVMSIFLTGGSRRRGKELKYR